MKEYICISCDKLYTEKTVPSDFVCKDSKCSGEGLTGFCILREDTAEAPNTDEDNFSNSVMPPRECGLCVLLMDASGSMFQDPAFKNTPFPSQYGDPFCSKAEVVSKAAAQAIFELRQMTKAADAYVCAIKFDTRQALIFNDTVENIIALHQSPGQLARHLYDELKLFQGGTNITGALKMGHGFIKKFIEGKVPGMDNYTPQYDQQFIAASNTWIDIPNVRLMIYTDGEQFERYGAIKNPFSKEEIDLLMGAYVGEANEKGCIDLKTIIGKCPIHREQQFTLLDQPTKIASLKGFFRMASGASGFCPKCLAGEAVILR